MLLRKSTYLYVQQTGRTLPVVSAYIAVSGLILRSWLLIFISSIVLGIPAGAQATALFLFVTQSDSHSALTSRVQTCTHTAAATLVSLGFMSVAVLHAIPEVLRAEVSKREALRCFLGAFEVGRGGV
jgi:hypothetical protein